jgi:hypothetical protein
MYSSYAFSFFDADEGCKLAASRNEGGALR